MSGSNILAEIHNEPSEGQEAAGEIARMSPSEFPDVVVSGGRLRILGTLENAAALLGSYGIVARYDIIAKKTRIEIPGAKGSADNADNSAITRIISLAKRNGMPVDMLPAYVQVLADENPENPVKDWIFGVEWDGVDRLPQICNTLKVKPGYPEELRDVLVYRWLISAVAAAIMPTGFSARGVLTLQGAQGIGKTTWLRALVSDQKLAERLIKIDHLLDPNNKDSVLGAVSHWIVELGELDGCFRKNDIARIKGFLTALMDKLRRPYDRVESEYQRRTVFFASVNDGQFLVDETGNTRFWTVPVESVNFRHGIDMQQLWRQVAELYLNGERWWLSKEEESVLEDVNRGHRVVSSVREIIVAKLDMDATCRWEKLTASEVLIRVGFDRPTNPQAREAGVVLREILGEPTKSKGVSRWNVPPLLTKNQSYEMFEG